jgi:TRAP-type C4-dicarboxylate transport system permease small subunit
MFTAFTRLLGHGATVANVLLTVFVASSAVMRYLFGAPLHFTEELVGLLFLIGVSLALPQASVRDEHIKVSLVTDALAPRARAIALAMGRLTTLVFVAWLLWLALDASNDARTRGLVSEQAGFPTWIAYAVIALSAGGIFIATLRELVQPAKADGPEKTVRSIE